MALKLNDIARNTRVSSKKPQHIRWICVKSRLLNGETILVVFDEEVIPELKRRFPDTVIYSFTEIKELYPFRYNKEFIKKVHLAKRKTQGQIIPTEGEKPRKPQRGGHS